MRLIDAERLTDGKGVFSQIVDFDFKIGIAYVKLENLMKAIENSPTVCDLDKISEQLEVEKEAALELCDNNAHYNAYCRAIDIVKSGGVEQVATESAGESEELKPCPFCGGTAEIKSAHHAVWCECMKCHAKMAEYRTDILTRGSAFAYAVKEWNIRV